MAKDNLYFSNVHEESIILYNNSASYRERNDIFKKIIQPVFLEMIHNIGYKYGFGDMPNFSMLKEECMHYLVLNMHHFNPSKGCKAFSYFSTIIKNFFIANAKKNRKKIMQEISYDHETISCIMDSGKDIDTYSESIESDMLEREFWREFILGFDTWDIDGLTENEKKMYDSIRIVLRNIDNIEIFHKKAIFMYLRELTGFSSIEISKNIKKIRQLYKSHKR